MMKIKTNLSSGTGLGDCMEKIAHALGFDELAGQYEKVSGRSCGCRARRDMLNKAVPRII